jgi:hypothetical protein
MVKDMLDPWYVTGFCDGEAAFTYSRNGGSYGLYFGIKQREDNRQILDDIWAFFHHVGYIYRGKEIPPTPNSGLTKACAYYRVTKTNELLVIVDHFDKYPLQSQKKLEAYKIWREMVIYKSENYRRIDYLKLHNLALKLSQHNIQSRSFKVHSH